MKKWIVLQWGGNPSFPTMGEGKNVLSTHNTRPEAEKNAVKYMSVRPTGYTKQGTY